MALGQVQINNLNLMQGPVTEIERHALFVGLGIDANDDTVITVTADTDLDAVLGTAASNLKTQVEAARDNAGQNWIATLFPRSSAVTWDQAVDNVMESTSVEFVVVTDPITDASDVTEMMAKTVEIQGKYQRPLFFIASAPKIDSANSSWSEWSATTKNLVNDVLAPNVKVVPTLFGTDQGTLAGRLCNRAVTVADTPMRVQTGGLIGNFATKPVDNSGRELDMGVLTDLANARLSVPQWYPDIPGVFWGDGAMLDMPGGDYQVVENLRVVQKAMRRLYPIAVSRIGDRKLNTTPGSIEASKNVFMKPLLEMSRSTDILGITFPGEIEKPDDGDIAINWISRTQVDIYMFARPYACPKKIGVNIALDLNALNRV